MAFAYSTSEGYIKASEDVAVAAASGSDVNTAGSSLAVKGKGMVFAKADESTGVTAILQYTLDSSAISIGGIGADPNGRELGSQTWVAIHLRLFFFQRVQNMFVFCTQQLMALVLLLKLLKFGMMESHLGLV